MTASISISQPRFVVLDTSHLAGLASDWASFDRSRRRAARVFAPGLDGENGWRGTLVCDDFSGYKACFEMGVTEAGCLAHARRKFHEL